MAFQAAAITLLGLRASLILAIPIAYASFLVPFGDEIVPQLQAITAYLATGLTQLSGVDMVSDGIHIDTPAGLFVFEPVDLAGAVRRSFFPRAAFDSARGPVLLGETLVELSRKAHFLEHDYWPRVQALRTLDAGSVVRPFREMGHGVAAGFSHAVVAADPELHASEARAHPFHPSLRRRLSALRMRAAAQPVPSGSAAEHFFPGLLPSLAWIFDRAWWAAARNPRHPMTPPDAP